MASQMALTAFRQDVRWEEAWAFVPQTLQAWLSAKRMHTPDVWANLLPEDAVPRAAAERLLQRLRWDGEGGSREEALDALRPNVVTAMRLFSVSGT